MRKYDFIQKFGEDEYRKFFTDEVEYTHSSLLGDKTECLYDNFLNISNLFNDFCKFTKKL